MAALRTLRLNELLIYIMTVILPNRIKRLIFLSSLTALLIDIKEHDEETLHKLNVLLQICSHEKAMMLPISLRNFIWHNMTASQIMNTEVSVQDVRGLESGKLVQMVRSIVSTIPSWLKYSENYVIECDVENLLKNCGRLTPA